MSKTISVSVSDDLHQSIMLNRGHLSVSKVCQEALKKSLEQLEEKRLRMVCCKFCGVSIDPLERDEAICSECYKIRAIVANVVDIQNEGRSNV